MDISKFTENRTGSLVPMDGPPKDHAFIPDPLPPKWKFDPNLWPLLAEAKRCLGMLDGAARILPNPELFLKPLQRVESLTSSRLEGTYATAQEVMLFELNPKDPQTPHDQANAWLEVANYTHALMYGCHKLVELPFCTRVIKELHKILLTGVRGSVQNPGELRSHQVHIGSNRRYVPPPHQEAAACLYALEDYCNRKTDAFDPLVQCFLVHYQLEAIHPFGDGNGRIGRVVLSLMIYKWCDLHLPWLYLSPYFERYKTEYIDNLFDVSANGEWSKWIEFCLRGVIDQATKAVDKCRRLQALRENMHERTRVDGGTRIHAIIESLFGTPYLRTAELARRFGVRYQTAKSDVSYLVRKNILAELRDFPIKTFFSPEIFTLAYSEDDNVPGEDISASTNAA
jgi:cell filamentation protein, protein adenylyltransferase